MKDLIRAKPRFAQDRVANRIRHAIQHLDEQVLDGRVPENTPFALMATGKEAPIAEEPGQTLKTIDGIQIGNLEIRFSELCALLVEMGQYAERLCKFERVQQT
jgi:hypothetical protein